MPEPDDITLLKQYAGGDDSAFTRLFERYVHLVYSTALRQVRNPSHAEEVTQAVFILLARKAKSLSPKTVLSGWLYQAARLTTANLIKREIRRQRREQEVYMQTLTEPDTSLWEQISPLLDDAMGRLGEQDRNAIVLRFFENRTPQEVAAALKLNEATARKRVSRALEKLRTFFAKRGVVLTTAIIAGSISSNSVQAAPAALANPAIAVALVKGTGGSGSTLTLIKGALKLMAWTKMKTVIVVGSVVFLSAGTGMVAIKTVHAIRAARYPNIQGAWEGIALLDDAGVATGEATRSHVVLRLAKSNGVYIATADWIEKGLKDVPMGRVIYDYPNLRLERNARETWNLKVNARATQMTWDHAIHFIQRDPVSLTRTSSPDEVPERLAENDFWSQAGSDLQGYWKGAIGNGPDALPIVFKIGRQADGTFRAEADNPMRGANGQPMSVSYNRPTIKLAIASGAGMFQGRINDAHTEMTGSWVQGGQSTPTYLKRIDYRADQHADKDYSFNSKYDLQGHWKGSWNVTLENVKATIRLALDLAKLPDGSYSATLANLDEFGANAPVPTSTFEYASPDLHMEWKWQGWVYDGKLKDGKLDGTWSQGGGRFSLVFERTKD